MNDKILFEKDKVITEINSFINRIKYRDKKENNEENKNIICGLEIAKRIIELKSFKDSYYDSCKILNKIKEKSKILKDEETNNKFYGISIGNIKNILIEINEEINKNIYKGE